jgi:hypothetical protein
MRNNSIRPLIELNSFKDLENREKELNQPVHIINIDITDNHEDATLGAFMLYELAMIVSFQFSV